MRAAAAGVLLGLLGLLPATAPRAAPAAAPPAGHAAAHPSVPAVDDDADGEPPEAPSPAAVVQQLPAATSTDAAPAAGTTPAVQGAGASPDASRPWLHGARLADLVGQSLGLVTFGHCEGVVCDDPRTLELLESLSELHAGGRIDEQTFDRSRSFLMASGYFRDVVYELHLRPVGVDVEIGLYGEVFVERVRIDVAEWFPAVFKQEIRERLAYRAGIALNPNPQVRTRQEETLRRLFENKGFEGTEVHISWTIANHLADITVSIREGRGYPLRHVHVRGNHHFSADEITQQFAGMLNLGGTSLWGATLVPALTREILEERETELMRLYGEDGFFEATVRARAKKDAQAKVIDLWVDVEEGPQYRIEFEGNFAIPSWELMKRLTFWESRSVTEPDAKRSAVEIRRAFQEEGYTFAEVSPLFDPKDPNVVRFRIRQGPKAEIESIHIKGNRAFEANDEVLKALMASGESGLLQSRRLLPEQLEEDRSRLGNFYRDHGYLRVHLLEPSIYFDPDRKVLYRPEEHSADSAASLGPPFPPADTAGAASSTPPAPEAGAGPELVVHRPPDKDRIGLYLDLPVEEGVQTRVRSLIVRGQRSVSREDVLRFIGLESGDPFSPERLTQGLNRLRQHFLESGFPNARVDVSCRSEGVTDDCTAEAVFGSVVDVMVRVEEGTQARLGEVFVRGNRRTLTQAILDDLRMVPGDLFNRTLLNEGQARIRSLGLFRTIRITEIGSQPEQPRERVALVIEVEEKEDRFVEFNLTLRSVGVEQQSSVLLWGVQTRYRDLNLLGRGLQLTLPLQVGNEITSFQPSLLWPRPFKLVLPTTWQIFATAQNDLLSPTGVMPVDASFGSFFGASSFSDDYNRFSFGTSLTVLLQSLWGLQATPSLSVARQGERKTAAQKLCLTGQGTTATCIDFDNLVRLAVPLLYDRRDNPLNPTHGWSAAAETDYALKLTIGTTTQAKTQYGRLLGGLQGYLPFFHDRLVLANVLRAGWIVPFVGQTTDIPIDDMFFLGGDGTVRGFAEKSVGPRDLSGVPLGDLFRLLATVEVRVHLAWWIWAGAFYDTGLLVQKPTDVAAGELRHSVGLGLRLLLLDLMPLRFDFARVIDQRPDDQLSIFTFNLGYPF